MTAFIVNTKDGDKLIVSTAVKGATFKEGKPGKPAQPAVEAVEAKPGVPADPAKGIIGEPPVAEVKAQEAKPAEEGEPQTVTFHTDDGDVEAIGLNLARAAELLNRG